MGGRHRAIVRGHGGLALRVLPTSAPGPGEVVLAVDVAGVCGTDLQILRGLRDDPTPVLGHEGLARVVTTGPGAPAHLVPGTAVVVNPTHPSDPRFLIGHTVNGMWQERLLIGAAGVSAGLVLPLDDDEVPERDVAALAEPLAVARHALSVLARFPIKTLLVVGDGAVGHLVVRAAGRDLRTIHVHGSAAGMAWSQARTPRADLLLTTDDIGALTVEDGPFGVVLATPRTATTAMLERVLPLLRGRVVVDLLGGLHSGAESTLVPGVRLAEVRSASTGRPPAEAVVFRVRASTGAVVELFGQRGVTGTELLAAAAELARAPDRYRDLVTHRVGPVEALSILQGLAAGGSRVVGGKRLIKLAIDMRAGEGAAP